MTNIRAYFREFKFAKILKILNRFSKIGPGNIIYLYDAAASFYHERKTTDAQLVVWIETIFFCLFHFHTN